MRRAAATTIAALALTGGAVVAAGAATTPPPGPVSHPPDAPSLRAAGIMASWPVRADREFAPNSRVVVRVRALREGTARPRVRVALQRVDADGHVLGKLARRTLRTGTFKARLGGEPGAHYALLLAVGKLSYASYFEAAGVPGDTTPPPPPHATPPAQSPCPAQGTTSFEVRDDPDFGRPGDHLTLTIINTGTTCLDGGWDYGFERQLPDGSYEPVTSGGPPVPAMAVTVQPGSQTTQGATVWDGLSPGAYRITKTLTGPDGPLTVAVPFTVQA